MPSRRFQQSCSVCQASFKSTVDVRNHEWEKHGGSNQMDCESCTSGFCSEQLMLSHLNIHKLYCCSLCSQSTNSWISYKEHLREHRKATPYVLTWRSGHKLHTCSHCVNGFNSMEDLESHLAKDNSRNFKECFLQNDFILNENETLKGYMVSPYTWVSKDETGRNYHYCLLCDKTVWVAQKHHHKLHFTNGQLSCMYCLKEFALDGMKELLDHMKGHGGERPYECLTCGATFPLRNTLVGHVKQHLENRVRRFKCTVCSKTFLASSALKTHMLTHEGSKDFLCSICNKGFLTNGKLNRHMQIHGSKPLFKCPVCNRGFSFKENIKHHLATHGNKRPHVCSDCGRGFNFLGNLRRHMTIHTGARPFQCDLCEARFSVKASLASHMLTHTKEKRYKCDLCGKRTATLGALVSHKRTHDVVGKYKCTKCELSLRHPSCLKSHMIKMHNENNPFTCKICNGKFPSRRAFNQDQSRHRNQGSHICDVCNQECPTYKGLQRHKALVHVDRLFRCETCHIGFKTKSKLERHYLSLTHSGQRNVMKKKLAENGEMKKGHRAFPCESCGDTFKSRKEFTRHDCQSDLEFDFCDSCGESFDCFEDFEKHDCRDSGDNDHHDGSVDGDSSPLIKMESEAEELIQDDDIYPCGVCEKVYTSTDGLEKHIVEHEA